MCQQGEKLVLVPIAFSQRVHHFMVVLLEPLSLSNVAKNGGEMRLCAEFELVHGELERECAPVSAPTFDFASNTDDLCLAGAAVFGKVVIVPAPIGLAHENVDVLPDKLFRLVPEEPLRRRIHALDCPVHISCHDPVDDVVDDRADAGSSTPLQHEVPPAQIEYDSKERHPDHCRCEQRGHCPPVAALRLHGPAIQ